MNLRQKVLFLGLQLIGMGFLIGLMGWIVDYPLLYGLGGAIGLFGLLRTILLYLAVDKSEGPEPDEETLAVLSSPVRLSDLMKEDEEEED